MVQHLLIVAVDGNVEFLVFLVGSGPFDFVGRGTADCNDLGTGNSVQKGVYMAFSLYMYISVRMEEAKWYT